MEFPIRTMTVTQESRVRRTSDAFVDAEIDDELVFMDVEKGQFYGLKETGLAVWRLLGDDGAWVTVGALVRTLTEEFEVDEDTCLRDLTVLLEDLSAAGLVELKTDTPGAGGMAV